MNIASSNVVDVLRLIRTPGIGPITFFNIMERFENASDALAMLPELSKRGGRKKPLVAYDKSAAEREIEQSEKFGARMIMFGEPDYPELLTTIPDAPPIITVMGHTHLWKKPLIAMVGARNASASGCQLAQKLAKDAGDNELITISGLARGIDTFVHKGSLTSGTIAVIAGGIDNIYPPENKMLYAQIKEMGCVISEQPFGAVPFAGAFPGRNRIIAGMSMGTIVVEASPKSGSLITARLAGEYGREVFAVPGSPLDPRSKGCNQLLKQGATMVENIADIIQATAHLRGRAMAETPAARFTGNTNAELPAESELEKARTTITEKLGYSPVDVDEIVSQSGYSASIVLTILLELELAGRLRRNAGNKVTLVANMAEEVA